MEKELKSIKNVSINRAPSGRFRIACIALFSATLTSSCGQDNAIKDHSNSTVASESLAAYHAEVYYGSEKGGECKLFIIRNEHNEINRMEYFSEKCTDPFPTGRRGCQLGLEKGSSDLQVDFSAAASVQFPGYTRQGFQHAIASPIPLSFVAEDSFILSKDNFTTLKVVRRLGGIYFPIPLFFNWTSDCLNVKKMDPETASRLNGRYASMK